MISIIVPIYNAGSYLPACIESLFAQTERDLRIILVDDGSTDGSCAVAQSFAARDPRIVLLQQPHAGQSAARNLGMAHAQGEYIAFVDADDRIENDWCERHLAAIAGVDYVQSGYKRVRDTEDCNAEGQLPRHRYQFTSPCMRLYRRQTLEGLRFTEGMIYEDVLFSTELWSSGATCRLIPYTGYLYTLNPASTTAVRRPEHEKRIFASLRKKAHTLPWRYRWIAYFTIIRLKLHFIRS